MAKKDYTGHISQSGLKAEEFDDSVADLDSLLQLIVTRVSEFIQVERVTVSAKIALERSEISLKELRETIEIEVLDALRNIDIQWKQVKLAKMARELSEQKLKIERKKLNVGKTTNFQIVSFENDLVTAQNSELDAIIGYSNSLSSLDQTLGTTLRTWKIEVRGDTRQELTQAEKEEGP